MANTERLHALDAVRAFALLAGIVLHATMSFFLMIPAQDSSQSVTLGVTFYVIHIFRMSTFFLMAGFFAHMVLHRKGFGPFVRDRMKRIGVPMVAGWIILAPLTIGITIWGLTKTFAGVAPEGATMPELAFPLVHLWFLYYLGIFYALALAARWGFETVIDRSQRLRTFIDVVLRIVLRSYVAPLLFALPIGAVLYFNDAWLVWFGVPTPDSGLTPKLPAMIAFGTAFGLGWLLHRQTDLLDEWEKRWPAHLTAAVALTVASLMIVGVMPNIEALTVVPGPSWARLAYTACYTAAIWYWTFAIVGAALRFCSQANALRRYVADSSYWLYLAHLPIVFFLQVVLMDVPLHWSLKFPLLLAITFAVLFTSYHYLVRPTFLGKLLNGRKHQRGKGMPGGDPDPDTGGGAPEPKRRVTDRSISAAPPLANPARAPALLAALRGVQKRYGKTVALAGVDLEVRQGEVLAVLGPNGAGKSTAISLWLGLLEPDDGHVELAGGSPLDVEARREVGVMMQEVGLTPGLRVREHVALAASYYPNPLTVAEALAITNTTALALRAYGKLSAGQKRQVQFAIAIVGRPKLLFLDEPTVGLDIKARETMWAAIRALVARGCSIVLTTHYLEEAEALADRVAVLDNGRLIAEGTVDEIRSLVSCKHISCSSTLAVDDVQAWAGVVDARRDRKRLRITAVDAEVVVRRLLAADQALQDLEVRQAGLTEAFTELTKKEAA